jgi:hypothetical protein
VGSLRCLFPIQFIEWRSGLSGLRKSLRRNWLHNDRYIASRNGIYVRCDGALCDFPSDIEIGILWSAPSIDGLRPLHPSDQDFGVYSKVRPFPELVLSWELMIARMDYGLRLDHRYRSQPSLSCQYCSRPRDLQL